VSTSTTARLLAALLLLLLSLISPRSSFSLSYHRAPPSLAHISALLHSRHRAVQDHNLLQALPVGAVDLLFSKSCKATTTSSSSSRTPGRTLNAGSQLLSPDLKQELGGGQFRTPGNSGSSGTPSKRIAVKKLDFDAFLRALLEVAAITSKKGSRGRTPGSAKKGAAACANTAGRRSSTTPKRGTRQHVQSDALAGLTAQEGTDLLREMALSILG
jgi:hypothetical protein